MKQSALASAPSIHPYVAATILAGTTVIAYSLYSLLVHPVGSQWLLLAALTLLTGSFSIKVPSINAYISVSETFVFASVLLFGPEAGTLTVLLECLVIVLWMQPQGRSLQRVLFNMAAPSLSIWLAGNAFYAVSYPGPHWKDVGSLQQLFIPLFVLATLYFLLNSWLVAIAVGVETRSRPIAIWWSKFAWLSINYFSGASLAALVVKHVDRFDLRSLAIIVPLLVVSYLTFRVSMARAEDSYAHLAEINRLHVSTVETLAMAIDAKDQVTHGHIRRVQTYAVGLARELGVSDGRLLQAIKAAALLHDMGKLAVPEHILNKPGKLTAPEFEKMKTHAAVGADILSAIDFPYPVVPIVRHHHENWDGTGYPTGLRGIDIPIGARILSVVDCFDALTSDRPYRPKLSSEEATQILLERRGQMYDPMVVDTFLRVFERIAPSVAADDALIDSIQSRMQRRDGRSEVADDSRRAVLLGNRRELGRSDALIAGGEVINGQLREIAPFDLAILFLYDPESDALAARHVTGNQKRIVREMRLAVGRGVSGWVAANRRSALNSDAVLDLGDVARVSQPELRYTLSVCLAADERLLGVLSLYSAHPFTDDHAQQVEALSPRIVSLFESARSSSTPAW